MTIPEVAAPPPRSTTIRYYDDADREWAVLQTFPSELAAVREWCALTSPDIGWADLIEDVRAGGTLERPSVATGRRMFIAHTVERP